MKTAMMLTLGLALLFSSLACARNMTNQEFIGLSLMIRIHWYDGAIKAIGQLYSEVDLDKAQCVWDWMSAARVNRDEQLMAMFRAEPDSIPIRALVSAISADCGQIQIQPRQKQPENQKPVKEKVIHIPSIIGLTESPRSVSDGCAS